MHRATRETLRGIIDATDPKAAEASVRNTRDPVRRAALADPDAVRLLNEAAREMMREAEAEAEDSRRSIRYRIGAAVGAWRDRADPGPAGPSPSMRMAMEAARAPTRAPSPAMDGAVCGDDARPAPVQDAGRGASAHQADGTARRDPGPGAGTDRTAPASRPEATGRLVDARLTQGPEHRDGRSRSAPDPGRRAQTPREGPPTLATMPEMPTMPTMPTMPGGQAGARLAAAGRLASALYASIAAAYDKADDRIRFLKMMTVVGRRMLAEEAEGLRQPDERPMLADAEKPMGTRADSIGQSASRTTVEMPVANANEVGHARSMHTIATHTSAGTGTSAVAPPADAREVRKRKRTKNVRRAVMSRSGGHGR